MEPSLPTPLSNQKSSQYSAFWPMLIIVATVVIISIFELVNLLGQRQQIRLASVQAEKQVKQAQLVSGTLGKISKELVLLSATSTEAQKIVREFGIQVRPPDAAKK